MTELGWHSWLARAKNPVKRGSVVACSINSQHQLAGITSQLASAAQYDNHNARALLAGSGIHCPPLSSYVETWITAVQNHVAR